MKKKIMAVAIAIMVLALICTGCSDGNKGNSSQSSTPSIVGTWKSVERYSFYDTLVFYDSGTVNFYGLGEFYGSSTYSVNGTAFSFIIHDPYRLEEDIHAIGTFSSTSLSLDGMVFTKQ